MKSTEYKRVKKKLNKWKMHAVLDALFPFGRSIPDVAGPFKLALDVTTIFGVLSLLISFQPCVAIGVLFSAGVSCCCFAYTLIDNFSHSDYKKLQQQYVTLKSNQDGNSNHEEMGISKDKFNSKISAKSMSSTINSKNAYVNGYASTKDFSNVSQKAKTLIKKI